MVLTEGEEVPGATNGGADIEEVPVAAVEASWGARAGSGVRTGDALIIYVST